MSESFHQRLKGRVVKTEDWEMMHRPHLHGQQFSLEGFPHPSGRWFFLVCKCGKKHLIVIDEKDLPNVETYQAEE